MALLALAACRGTSDAPTAEENRQLDDAANLLDQAPANLESVDDAGLEGANVVESNAP
jgi:hypothetical protein